MSNIEKILEDSKEILTIEFKREWYWEKKQEDKGRLDWNEFLKDFTVLSNIIDENKYFIINVNDDRYEFLNYFEDSNKNKLSFFSRDIDNIKNEIIEKILNFLRQFDLIHHKYKILSSKNTIKHLVEAYTKFLYNRYSIIEYKSSMAYSNSDFFEIYSITQNDKYLELFIYFSKYSSIQKILENNKITILSKNVKYFDSPIQFIEKTIYFQVKNELFPKRFSWVFVNALINNRDIVSTMKQWINAKHSPIFALIGSSGILKTTIAKKICSQVENYVIFIDSKDLISNLRYIEKLNTIYDFVKLFIKSQSNIQIDENYFSEEMINVLVDSGKSLIIIDSLDKVILNYSDVYLNDFIKTIYNNCLYNLGQTKILLTIQDTFWKKEYEKNIESFIINGFDIDKSKEYFYQKIEDAKKGTKALPLLQRNLKDDNIFSPFILQIISLAIENKISKKNIDTNYIYSNIFIDNLIYHICKRKLIKFTNIYSKNIEKQIEFFIKISIEYNGNITLKQLFSILNRNIAKVHQTHPLISLEETILSCKFYILIEYFTILFAIKIINQNINNYQDDLLQKKNNILFKQICLNNQYLMKINNIEELKFLYIQMIDRLENIQVLKKYKYIFSFILSILLQLNTKKDKQLNTELIQEILNKNDKYIGLCLSDNYFHDKFLFCFDSMTFECCYIEYDYFGNCNFDNNTIFCNSIIKG